MSPCPVSRKCDVVVILCLKQKMSSKTHKHTKAGTTSKSKSQTQSARDVSVEKSNLEWCEWYWSDEYQCWVRSREKSDGTSSLSSYVGVGITETYITVHREMGI